jgi:diguanylate cyclase (GGDEF)-like protein
MSRLAAVRQAQARSLDELRSGGPEQSVLVELTQATCLLELAKLSSGRLDLTTWAASVVELLPQFFPVDAIRIEVRVEDLPPVVAEYGQARRAGALQFGLGSGTLCVVGSPSASEFFVTAAAQLSGQLEAVIDSERLRRRAAGAEALKIAAALDDLREVECLHRLAGALSALPSAIGAGINLEHRLVGGVAAARSGLTGHRSTHQFKLGDGVLVVDVEFATEPSAADEGALVEVLEVLVDALERAEEQLRLREEAETDPLTGCGNRRRAGRALALATSKARADGEQAAALAFDLDHFKRVNDTLGHPAGDEVLRRFADGLRSEVREWDVVCRMGGEEFLVVCASTDALGAEALANRVRAATPVWCAPALPDGWRQTTSVGVAVFPVPADTVDRLLRGADEALYEAKRAGRDRVVVA